MNMNIGLKNQERTIFSPKVFDLSRKFEFDHVETEQGKVIIIDHFYKNFEAVQQEIQKIPICELGTDEEIENRGEKFFIGRRSHVIGMRGTVPPYREMVSRLVYNYFSLDRLNMNATHTGDFLVNVFRKGKDFPEETHYCFVHRDPVKDAPRSMAIVVFLNSSYEEGEGFAVYKPKDETDFNAKYGTTIVPKKLVDVVSVIPAKPNRALLFEGDRIFHGQYTPTKQFYSEDRLTQAIFVRLSYNT